MSIIVCTSCTAHIDTDFDWYDSDNECCESCHDAEMDRQEAYWRPLYDGEVCAGLVKSGEAV